MKKKTKKRLRRIWDVAFATYFATHADDRLGFVTVGAVKCADAAVAAASDRGLR
jgi:hypothetical protein